MINQLIYPDTGVYRTGSDYEPINFFIDVLPQSKHFDMLLGYFSSSAIRVLSIGFAKFIMNGGQARFVINNILSQQDKDLLIEGESLNDDSDFDPIKNYNILKNHLDTEGVHFFRCLSWLIAHKKIEIVIIKPKNNTGIAHYKSGLFSDGTHSIAFKGSCNFTARGLIDNLEEVTINRSWMGVRQFDLAIEDQKRTFDLFFSRNNPNVEYLNSKDIEVAIQTDFGNRSLDELLVDERELIKMYKEKIQKNIKFRYKLEQLSEEIVEYISRPRFPNSNQPRDYQMQAYEAWLNNNKSGIFAMATGTGKTITALNCLLQESSKNNNVYKALILVPTLDLAAQWESEARRFNFGHIITINSKIEWLSDLSALSIQNRLNPNNSFIIICSYSSFTKQKFQRYFFKLPEDTILIADEAHNIGSESIIPILHKNHLKYKIGLSATPNRVYDDEGTRQLELFFNDRPPYIFSFSIQKAIEASYLCQYRYYPHIVTLESDELESYIQLSKELLKYFDFEKLTYKNIEKAKILLLQRKRVIQKARNKRSKTKQILTQHFDDKNSLQYAFVYVPEGIASDYSFDKDEDDISDLTLLNEYVSDIKTIDYSITAAAFTAKTKNRQELLESFQSGKLNVLVAMKCLDEGVDVPRAELAIFCASTGNPRQFIQRRGRVLRRHPDKHLATIHDLVVVPCDFTTALKGDEQRFNMERNLVKKELERVVEFAFLSINEYQTHDVLKDVCEYYNISLQEIYESLKK